MAPVPPTVIPAATRWAEVDVGVLRDNTRALGAVAGEGCALMAMVKAAGYGHGALTAARAALAGGATWLGVSSVPEALELREAGIAAPVLDVGWATPTEMATATAAGVDVTVFDPDGVSAAAQASATAARPARVHWKVDTGMGRLGTRPEGMEAMWQALRGARHRIELVGLFTHFASADGATLDFAEEQLARFLDTAAAVGEAFPGVLVHAANSAALLRIPGSRLDMVRPGIAVYGYPPVTPPADAVLRPALALRALVSQVKRLVAGDTVGYGRDWTAQRPSLIATVAVGYGDGVDRRNANRGAVIVGGVLCPIVGRVSMDQIGVDVSDAGEVHAADVVTLIGADAGHAISAADVAARIGTISYEVLSAISARVPRVVIDSEGVLA